MDGRLERMIAAAIVAATLAACDKPPATPDPLPDAAAEKAKPATMPGVPLDEWVNRVQAVRDREFSEPPGITPVTEPRKRVAPDSVRADRDAILAGLFGRDEPWTPATPPELEIAWWDGGENLVKLRTDIEVTPEEREEAVLLALLRGLEDEHGPDQKAPDSWDEWLAYEALRMGPAYFGLALLQAKDARDSVTADDVATFPGVVGELPVIDSMYAPEGALEDRAATFAPRQGHGLAAAMYRASGWSGVEMLWHDRPESTAWVVRPDRWLSGDGLGTWEWPKIPTQIREKDGWKLEREGRVGPAITSLFLSTAVQPAQARTVYVTWQSDTYRSWTKGDSWLFEWATIWSTPTAAEEFVVVAERALQKQGRDGRFAVLRQGNIVALLGSNDPKADLDRHATSVVAMRPQFVPRDPGMISFKPTPADRAADGIAEAQLADNLWSDPYVGLKITTDSLSDWDLRRANELSIRWFARKDGALIQFATELPRPLAPKLADDAWKESVIESFRKTVRGLKVVQAERADFAGQPGWVFEFTGAIEGRDSRVFMRQTLSQPDRGTGTPRVLTLSLQEPRGDDSTPEKTPAQAAFDAISVTVSKPWVPTDQKPEPQEGGLLPRNE